jgi:maltose O-acetyltransferase
MHVHGPDAIPHKSLPVLAQTQSTHGEPSPAGAAISRPKFIYKRPKWSLFEGVMAIGSLNRLRKLRLLLTGLRRHWLQLRSGVAIDPTASISLSSRFMAGRPGGVQVGAYSLVAFKTLLDARDLATGAINPIRIGQRCFIGGGSMIMPGVTVGDESIVAAGAVVFDDVPPRSIVAGNPARVVRSDIKVGHFGRLEGADDNTRRMYDL